MQDDTVLNQKYLDFLSTHSQFLSNTDNVLGYSFHQVVEQPVKESPQVFSLNKIPINNDSNITNLQLTVVSNKNNNDSNNRIIELNDIDKNEYNRNYLRNAILGLLKYNKPVIVTGLLQFNPYDYFYTFIDIKPFYPEYEKQAKVLCQHINISKRQIDAVLNLYGNKNYTHTPLVLICRPYSYKSNNEDSRGGLNLTAELGIPGIMTYNKALEIIPTIDKNKYVDFKDFGGGYFLGIDPIKEKKEKKAKKHQNKIMKKLQEDIEEIKNEEDENILFIAKDGTVVTKDKPIFQSDHKNNHLDLLAKQFVNLPNLKSTKKINVLDGWFLKI